MSDKSSIPVSRLSKAANRRPCIPMLDAGLNRALRGCVAEIRGCVAEMRWLETLDTHKGAMVLVVACVYLSSNQGVR